MTSHNIKDRKIIYPKSLIDKFIEEGFPVYDDSRHYEFYYKDTSKKDILIIYILICHIKLYYPEHEDGRVMKALTIFLENKYKRGYLYYRFLELSVQEGSLPNIMLKYLRREASCIYNEDKKILKEIKEEVKNTPINEKFFKENELFNQLLFKYISYIEVNDPKKIKYFNSFLRPFNCCELTGDERIEFMRNFFEIEYPKASVYEIQKLVGDIKLKHFVFKDGIILKKDKKKYSRFCAIRIDGESEEEFGVVYRILKSLLEKRKNFFPLIIDIPALMPLYEHRKDIFPRIQEIIEYLKVIIENIEQLETQDTFFERKNCCIESKLNRLETRCYCKERNMFCEEKNIDVMSVIARELLGIYDEVIKDLFEFEKRFY